MNRTSTQIAQRLESAGLLVGFALAPVLSVYATKATATFLAAAALLLVAARLADARAEPLAAMLRRRLRRPLPAALAAFAAWAALSALWSPEPAVSAGYALRLVGSLALGLAWCLMLRDVGARKAWPWAAAGAALALLLIAVEFAAPPGIRGLIGAEAQPFDLNRPVVVAGAMAAFLLALAARLGGGRRRLAFGLCLFAVAVAFASESQSALLFWAVFAAAAAVERVIPTRTARLVAAVAALLLVLLPVAVLAWHGMARSAVAGDSAPALLQRANAALRLDIWHDYMVAARQRPLAGWGIGAERLIEAPAASDPSRPLRRHTHPHSLAIQTWVNFGAVGAVLGAAVLLLAGRALPAARRERLPGTAPLFAALVAVWMVSHGAWQEWWLALVALSLGSLACLRSGDGERARDEAGAASD